ncbi:MAG: HD domain-containing protein [Lachnospiraceae bacterium]|nr:HD domain-containing protein [Lachnospiraceae bacterium]
MMADTETSALFRRKHNISTFFVCLAGIALNLLLSYIVTALELPLYLDTVGTVAVAIMGGYLPGVVVGFATNIVKTVLDPASLYYGSLNVIIAILAAFFSSHGWHKKITGIIGMIIAFTLIGGGLGFVIPWFMEELTFDSESLAGILYETGHFNMAVSCLLSSLIMDLPDKIMTMLIVIIAVRLIPEKYYEIFSFKGWLQEPFQTDRTAPAEKIGVRRLSLQTKILLVLALSLFVISSVAMGIGMSVYNKTVVNDHARMAQGTAKLAASVLDGDRIDEFLESRGTAEGYAQSEELLSRILNSSTDITYLYVYQIREDGCHVVFDIDTEGLEGEDPGTLIEFDEGFSDYLGDLLAGKRIDPIITNDTFGNLLTAYEPVYDSSGRCVCYVGADVDMFKLGAMQRSFYVEVISVFLVYFLLIMVFAIWLAKYHIIIPVNSIMKCMDRIANTSDTQQSMDEDVKLFRSLGIHTGDEIENLYKAACRMTKKQAEQMRSIRRLSDSTAKMQDGLITTMADMVESRDSDTGAHVQKTAAYVKIIVEGLRKKGYYANKITPKFMSDVVRSAPLHDIGKINIPDGILNKPGKLTDEEFAIMKTHTTAGKKIMENAISTIEGDNYLKEARNMAAYHHERWDGKGYPEGLHGEVIPLAARIMSVADVFDALASPRVYKPAFPLEKALAIIEEGKGTQFDPKCVEVFMDSLDEVKAVLKKYNPDV